MFEAIKALLGKVGTFIKQTLSFAGASIIKAVGYIGPILSLALIPFFIVQGAYLYAFIELACFLINRETWKDMRTAKFSAVRHELELFFSWVARAVCDPFANKKKEAVLTA